MGWNVSCAYLVYCVSRLLFRMSLAMDVRCATYSVRLAMDVRCVTFSVRLAMDHVEGFVLCLQVRRGGWCH